LTAAQSSAGNTAAVIGGRVEFSSDSAASRSPAPPASSPTTTVVSDLQSVSKIDVSTVDGSNKPR
jgi:flagellin